MRLSPQEPAPPPHSIRTVPGVWGLIAAISGLTSMWLVFPLVAGTLGLLREFWCWAVLCLFALWGTSQRDAVERIALAFAWSLLLAALINAGQGFLQAYRIWNHAGTSDVYGFLHQRNQFATLCLMGLAAAAWINHRYRDTLTAALSTQALATLPALVLGAAISLSASRTGLLALGTLWAASELLAHRSARTCGPRQLRQTLRMGIIGYGLALAPALLASSLTGDLPSVGILARQSAQEGLQICTSRLSLWANVLELISLRPWTGWGWGELDYAHFVTPFRSPRFCELLSNAHNLPLHLAVELGLPAALLVTGLACWGVLRARPWGEQVPTRLLAWSLLLSMAIHSMLEYPWWYGPFQGSALLALWILWRTRPQAVATPPQETSGPDHTTGVQLILVSLVALTIVVACDFYRASQIYLPADQRLGSFRSDTRTQIRSSIWFQDLIDFADLGLEDVRADNADHVHALALKMLHFSPEAMVIQKLLDSAQLLGRVPEYEHFQQRFAAAYPQAFQAWKARQPTP